MIAEGVIAYGDCEIRVASDVRAGLVTIASDDGTAETFVEIPPGRARALISALNAALRDLED